MKEIPRLLRFSEGAVIPPSVPADLQLDRLFSAGAIRILCRPCGKENISARQELFAKLANEAFCARVSALRDTLRAYRDTLAVWRNAASAVEKCFLQRRVLWEYADVCDALVAFSGEGQLLGAVADAFGRSDLCELRTRMREDCQRIETHLKPLCRVTLSLADQNRLLPEVPTASDYERVASLAIGVGLTVPDKKRLAFHQDPTLSGGFDSLFADEIQAANAIFDAYRSVELNAPTVYIDEVSFFLEIDRLIRKAQSCGFPCCMPRETEARRYLAVDLCDPALLLKNETAVPSDTYFDEEEAFFFLVGANGGGKTTYLRAVASNLLLFLAGCPILAREAEIYPFSSVLTHFPVDERFFGVGRLDEERARVTDMLSASDADAFLAFNETFSGADDKRGYTLLSEMAEEICAQGRFGLCVTHFLQVGESRFPVLTAAVDPSDSDRRTYRIVKKRDTLSSYAADILRRYGLDAKTLSERRCRHEA